MSLRNNLLSEFLIIIAILVIGYIAGWNDVVILMEKDIGMIMAIIGVMWAFGALLKANAMAEAAISIVIGIGLTIFGITLHTFGLGHALLVTGIYSFFMNKFVRDIAAVGNIVLSNVALSICALISIGFIIVGYPIRNMTPKADPQPEYYQDIKDTNMECRVDIDVFNKNNITISTRTIGHLRGSEESIYQQARKIPKGLRNFESLERINIVPTYIPPGCIPPGKEKFMGLSTKSIQCTYASDKAYPFHNIFSDIEQPYH